MATINLADFRNGLDARKYALALPAGTLLTANNCHINQGGEIEKRKAFTLLGTISGSTFGAQPTADGTVVFGSDANSTISNLPSGFIYQRLQHPQTIAGYADVAMTGIIHSEVFAGKAWAAASFNDGTTFAYFNGILINDFVAGLILTYLAGNNTRIAAMLAELVNATTAYTAIQAPSPSDNSLDVFSQPGNSYAVDVIINSKSNFNVTLGSNTGYQSATVDNSNGTNPTSGTKITIGSKDYTFRTALTPTEGEVLIGATVAATLLNLYNAINHTGTPDVDYKCAAVNTIVTASSYVKGGPRFNITKRTINTAGAVTNTVAGLSYVFTGPTVPPSTATPAQGQFKIVNGTGSIYASGSIIFDGTVPASGSTITIGGKTYTFKSGTLTTANDVKQTGVYSTTLQNLIYAINGTGTAGTNYATGTVANANVTAGALNTNTIPITANAIGTAGNAFGLEASSGTIHLTSTVPTLMTGGITNTIANLTVGPIYATGQLTGTATNVADGDYITIGSIPYRFKTVLALENDVLIGASADDSLQNLIYAINRTGTPDTNYKASAANPHVSALPTATNRVLTVRALVAGVAANAIGLYTTGGSGWTWGATALLQGGSDSVALLPSAWAYPAGATTAQAATSVAAAINAYSATSGFKATTALNTVYLNPVASNSFYNDAVVTVTVTGYVIIGFCAFQILKSKSGTVSGIFKVLVDGAEITVAGGVTYATSVNATVAAIVSSINATSVDYVAYADGNAIYLTSVVTRSTDLTKTVTVNISTTDFGVTEIGNAGISAVISPTNINFIRVNNKVQDLNPTVCVCKVAGGYPPYAYRWKWISGDPNFSATNETSQNTTFRRTDSDGSATAIWACQVTDAQNNVVTSNTITLYQL